MAKHGRQRRMPWNFCDARIVKTLVLSDTDRPGACKDVVQVVVFLI